MCRYHQHYHANFCQWIHGFTISVLHRPRWPRQVCPAILQHNVALTDFANLNEQGRKLKFLFGQVSLIVWRRKLRNRKLKPGLSRGEGELPPKTKSLLLTYATAGECLAKYMSGREVLLSLLMIFFLGTNTPAKQVCMFSQGILKGEVSLYH
jgi:hypothetical protein